MGLGTFPRAWMLPASFPSSLCKNRPLFLSLRPYLAIRGLHPFPCFLRKLCKIHTHFCIMDPVYISHGSPMLPLEDIPARDFLRRWRELMPEKPKAILAVSAHWNTTHPAVSATARNTTIHDFYGFPPDLYELQYNALGAPELARQVKDLLQSAGFNPVQEDAKRGLDHGAWVPLFLMYPDADIPVCQLSVQPYKDGRHHYEMGRALASLRNEGVLIMASGSATHNLRSISSDNSTPAWATSFDDWLNESLINGRFEDVIEFEKNAPNARKAHPSPEHFYPLLVALGAAGDDAEAQRIHSSWAHSSLSMACFNFKPAMIQKFKELSENPRSVGGSKELSENPGSVGGSKELSGNPRSLGGSNEPSYKGNFLQKFLVRILHRHV